MRALVQRVAEAEVTVAGRSTGRIGPGLLVLVCAMQGWRRGSRGFASSATRATG